MTPAKRRLLELVKQRSVIYGEVTLASGQKSHYYIDGKMSLLGSEPAALLGEVLYEMTRGLNLDAVGGPEVGAIPMATAAVIHYHRQGRTLEGFFVRKEVKAHGTQKRIEGAFRPGYRVAVLEDVMTTGGSSLGTIEAVRAAGGTIEAVICLVDRLQGARQKMEGLGLRFLPIFTTADLDIRPA
jgi:orotate phosphoribosyltransferase